MNLTKRKKESLGTVSVSLEDLRGGRVSNIRKKKGNVEFEILITEA